MLKTLVELQGQVLSNRGAEGQSDLALALKALSDQANSHQRAVKLSKDEAKETQDAVVVMITTTLCSIGGAGGPINSPVILDKRL